MGLEVLTDCYSGHDGEEDWHVARELHGGGFRYVAEGERLAGHGKGL